MHCFLLESLQESQRQLAALLCYAPRAAEKSLQAAYDCWGSPYCRRTLSLLQEVLQRQPTKGVIQKKNCLVRSRWNKKAATLSSSRLSEAGAVDAGDETCYSVNYGFNQLRICLWAYLSLNFQCPCYLKLSRKASAFCVWFDRVNYLIREWTNLTTRNSAYHPMAQSSLDLEQSLALTLNMMLLFLNKLSKRGKQSNVTGFSCRDLSHIKLTERLDWAANTRCFCCYRFYWDLYET